MPRNPLKIAVLAVVASLGQLAGGQTAAPASERETLLERAFVLDEGKQAPRNATAAAELYRAAAEAGDGFAHLRLGYLYETGDGVPQDYSAARAHYEAAAIAGLKEARLHLAICHLEGWGGPADRAAFVRDMRAAAEADDIPAQRIMSALCCLGFGLPVDKAEGVKWLERAAKLDDAAAQVHLGQRSEHLRRLALMPDATLARTWYQLSAEQEYTEGMRAMARTFLDGPERDRNWELGHHWLEMATEAGDTEAPYILAVFELLHVDAQQHDVAHARDWLKLASDRGNSRATEVLERESTDQPLGAAMQYVLRTPFDERYVQKEKTAAGNEPTRPPQLYRIVRPVYPLSLHMTETAGKALVDFVVDTTGRVMNPFVVNATHPLFGERAIEAVRQWRFHPAQKDGRPIRAHLQVPVLFHVGDEELDGVDNLLRSARNFAIKVGPEAVADAVNLRLAKSKSPLKKPVMDDGSALPPDVRAMLLLALDATGHPLRGYVLAAEPEAIGPRILAAALASEFQPQMVEDEPVASNAVLTYVTGRFRSAPVLQTK